MSAELSSDQSLCRFEKLGDYVSIYRRGPKWYANYQHDGKQRRKSLKTTSKKEAQSRARKIENQLQEGIYQRPAQKMTLQELIDKYIACKKAEEKAAGTIKKYRLDGKQILAFAESKRIKLITQINLAFADDFRQMRINQQIDRVTLHRQLVFLKQLMNYAVSRDYLATNSLAKLSNRRPQPNPQPCWSWKEMLKILSNAPDEFRAAFAMLGFTGMRAAELRWLTWDDVDLEKSRIHVRAKAGWKPKWGKERVFPIQLFLKPYLLSLPRKYQWVVPMPVGRRWHTGGAQLNLDKLRSELKMILKRLGLKGKLHTFRHAFISYALSIGIPPSTLRAWVGHDHQVITDLYTHITNEVSEEAMRRLAQAFQTEVESDCHNGHSSNSAQT